MNCITIKGRFANAEAIRADKESGLITDIIKNQHSMDVTIDGDVILPATSTRTRTPNSQSTLK